MSPLAHDPALTRASCSIETGRRDGWDASCTTRDPVPSARYSSVPAGRDSDAPAAARGWWAFKVEALAMAEQL